MHTIQEKRDFALHMRQRFPQFDCELLKLLKTRKGVFHMAGHTQRQWEGKFFRCGMRCFYCHKPLSIGGENRNEIVTKDHLTPISRGGSGKIDNVVPSCLDCNQRKSDLTEQEFRTAFSEAFKLLTGVAAAEPHMNLSMIDAPSWHKLKHENFSERPSWAWRNPA